MYLIMKSSLHLTDQDEFIPNAVGVFRLAHDPVNTLVQIIRSATDKKYIRGAALQACTFTGPELAGLTVEDWLNMTADQELNFHAQGFVFMNLEDDLLNEILFPVDAETIEVTAGGNTSWHCMRGPNEYVVHGAPLGEWQARLDEIVRQEIAEARKCPLTWKDAWQLVMNSGTEGVNIAMWIKHDDIKQMAYAIRLTLKDYRCQLTHIQKAQLEATLEGTHEHRP